MGTIAVALAAVNVFGGFLVTQRMLQMFKKKDRKGGPA
jgi:NAD(P) transhydrogenase subunit alpha